MERLRASVCIFVLALMLSGIGITMIYSASAPVAASYVSKRVRERKSDEIFRPLHYHWYFLRKQMTWWTISVLALLVLFACDYNKILKYSKWAVIGSFVLVVWVLLFGPEINGSKRWFRFGPISFQPSELAKLSLVVYMAKLLSERRRQLRDFSKGFILPVSLSAVFVCLIGIEDFGSAAVLGLIILIMWFIAGVSMKHLAALAPACIAVFVALVLMEPYRIERLKTHLFGGDPTKEAWHISNALTAVGSGGWTGLGLGMGIEKHGFVPAMHTDFIFANVCEETGFVGAVTVLLLFAALIVLGYRVARKSPDFVGGLLAAGLTTMIAVPTLVNVAVVLGVLPTKGLPLPFISYGGSSLLVNMCAVGITMSIARRNEETREIRQAEGLVRRSNFWRRRTSRAF